MKQMKSYKYVGHIHHKRSMNQKKSYKQKLLHKYEEERTDWRTRIPFNKQYCSQHHTPSSNENKAYSY